MTVWTATATRLADAFPQVLRLPDERSGDVPRITQALDQGATTLLAGFNPATNRLEYSPFFVERLIDEIAKHILSCSRIRDQAQQLEVQAFREIMDIASRQKIDTLIEAHLPSAKQNEPNQINNQISLSISGTTVAATASGGADPYWSTMWDLRDGQLAVSKDECAQRLAKFSEPGNGNNFVERFELLKSLFDAELIMLYKKIVAASVGLQEIFGLSHPVPTVRDIGYLNDLILWALDATNDLEKRSYSIDTLTVVVPFHDYNAATVPAPGLALMSQKQFQDARQAGSAAAATFNVSEATFTLPGGSAIANPRLRGFDLWFAETGVTPPLPTWASASSFRASITLPNQSSALEFVGHPSVLQIPNLMVQHLSQLSTAVDLKPLRKCYNVNPVGAWVVS